MYVWQPPGEFLYQRGWSYDHHTKRCYWNQPEGCTHVSVIFHLVCGSKTNPLLFFLFLFFFFAVFCLRMREKARGEQACSCLFKVLSQEKEKKKEKNFKAIPLVFFTHAGKKSHISVEALRLLVVWPSPLAEKLSRGLPTVHSLRMWFRSLVHELEKKLEIFFRSQRVI